MAARPHPTPAQVHYILRKLEEEAGLRTTKDNTLPDEVKKFLEKNCIHPSRISAETPFAGGAHGFVYEATYNPPPVEDGIQPAPLRVILKVPPTPLVVTPTYREAVYSQPSDEAEHIRKCIGIVFQEGHEWHHALVLERKATSLTSQRKQPMKCTEENIRMVAIQLLHVLASMHRKDQLHRDLKPDNILVVDDMWTIAVADFGLARTLPSGGAGTPGLNTNSCYAAPELPDPNHTNKVDIWSVAWICEYLRTGEDPKWIKNDPTSRPVLEDGNELLTNFLRKAWSVNPEDRPSAEEGIKILTNTTTVEIARYDLSLFTTTVSQPGTPKMPAQHPAHAVAAPNVDTPPASPHQPPLGKTVSPVELNDMFKKLDLTKMGPEARQQFAILIAEEEKKQQMQSSTSSN